MISIDIYVILCVYVHYFAGVHLFYDWGYYTMLGPNSSEAPGHVGYPASPVHRIGPHAWSDHENRRTPGRNALVPTGASRAYNEYYIYIIYIYIYSCG